MKLLLFSLFFLVLHKIKDFQVNANRFKYVISVVVDLLFETKKKSIKIFLRMSIKICNDIFGFLPKSKKEA